MLEFTKKGGSFKLKVAKINERTVLLRDCQSNDELTVSRNQLKHFGKIETDMVLNAYCHCDYNDSGRVFLYPDRTCSEPVRKLVDDDVKMNVIQSLPDFSLETLEKIARVISLGGNMEDLAAAAGVELWRRESERIEYKQGLILDEISEACVAMYNTQGGQVICGVSDKTLETIGIEGLGLTEDEIRCKILNHLKQTSPECLLFNKVSIDFDIVKGHLVCIINVPANRGNEIAYFKRTLVIRKDCTSMRLTGSAHTQWILDRFKTGNSQSYNSIAI